MTVKVPEVGVSKAAIARRKVVFPQPLGPMKLTNSPWPMLRFTSFNACTGPSAVWKTRFSPFASITGWLWLAVSFKPVVPSSSRCNRVAFCGLPKHEDRHADDPRLSPASFGFRRGFLRNPGALLVRPYTPVAGIPDRTTGLVGKRVNYEVPDAMAPCQPLDLAQRPVRRKVVPGSHRRGIIEDVYVAVPTRGQRGEGLRRRITHV